jgi:acylphosphatase
MKSVAIRVHGRVQGVGFRYHTQQVAQKFNINGLVKNMMDGSVYIEASGDDLEIEQFVAWCHQGPKWAYVEKVDINTMNDKEYSAFKISR